VTGATIQCLSHSANPAIEFGAAGWIPTSIDLLTRQVPLCVGHSSKLVELARSLELRSGAYRAPALPVELYQRSWRGDSNADHGLTRPELFPLSYTSTILLCDNLEAAGRIALPLVCFAGRCLAVLATPPRTRLTNLERKAGLEPALSTLATSRLGH
jgi:hypothetical protein